MNALASAAKTFLVGFTFSLALSVFVVLTILMIMAVATVSPEINIVLIPFIFAIVMAIGSYFKALEKDD